MPMTETNQKMQAESEVMGNDLCDRQQIRDVLTNYCRGLDRMDRDLLLSRYHSEVIEDQGFYVGGAVALWD